MNLNSNEHKENNNEIVDSNTEIAEDVNKIVDLNNEISNDDNKIFDGVEETQTVSKTYKTVIKKRFKPHISKRSGMAWYYAWLIRLGTLILSFVVSAFIIVLLLSMLPSKGGADEKHGIEKFFDLTEKVIKAMIDGNFKSPLQTWPMLRDLAILLCISLAVTPAFKMRFWNIGAEGQVLAGCLASAACMFYLWDDVTDNNTMIMIMLISSMAAGALWAVIPAFFKSKWNTNETLFTLMMNYVAIQLVKFTTEIWRGKAQSLLPINNNIATNKTKRGWFPDVKWFKGTTSEFWSNAPKYIIPIIFVAVITIIMFIYLKYTKHGYEISVVGESENTAKYVGINVKKVIIRTLILSGAICGIAGFLIVGGIDHNISTGSARGYGFTAIMVSWLAKFNPLTMVLTSFLISFLQHGAAQISTTFNVDKALPDIAIGIILFFVIGCEFFVNYKIHLFSKHEEILEEEAAE